MFTPLFESIYSTEWCSSIAPLSPPPPRGGGGLLLIHRVSCPLPSPPRRGPRASRRRRRRRRSSSRACTSPCRHLPSRARSLAGGTAAPPPRTGAAAATRGLSAAGRAGGRGEHEPPAAADTRPAAAASPAGRPAARLRLGRVWPGCKARRARLLSGPAARRPAGAGRRSGPGPGPEASLLIISDHGRDSDRIPAGRYPGRPTAAEPGPHSAAGRG